MAHVKGTRVNTPGIGRQVARIELAGLLVVREPLPS